jgi:hypothetical protein
MNVVILVIQMCILGASKTLFRITRNGHNHNIFEVLDSKFGSGVFVATATMRPLKTCIYLFFLTPEQSFVVDH